MVRRRSRAVPQYSRVVADYLRHRDFARAKRLAAREPDPRAAMAQLYVAVAQGIVPHPSQENFGKKCRGETR